MLRQQMLICVSRLRCHDAERRRVRSMVWFLRRSGERGGPNGGEEEPRFVSEASYTK